MADVGEEGGLGPVQLGQRLGAPPLVFVRAGVGDGGGHTRSEQVVEVPVCLVHRQAGADPGDEDCGGAVGSWQDDRQRQSRIRQFGIGADGSRADPRPNIHLHRRPQTDNVLQGPDRFLAPFQTDRLRAGKRIRLQTAQAHQTRLPAFGVQRIEQDEGHVEVVFGEGLRAQGEGFVNGLRLAGGRGKVTQGSYPPLTEHLAGHLDDGVEQAADPAGLVADGTEREREEALLQVAVPFKEDVLGLEKGRVASQGQVVRLADHRPRVLPALAEVLPHRQGMLAAANDPIAVVVELDQARTPDDADRQVGCEADVDRRAQALRPRLHRTERRFRPIRRPDQASHLVAAGEKRERVGGAGQCVTAIHDGTCSGCSGRVSRQPAGWRGAAAASVCRQAYTRRDARLTTPGFVWRPLLAWPAFRMSGQCELPRQAIGKFPMPPAWSGCGIPTAKSAAQSARRHDAPCVLTATQVTGRSDRCGTGRARYRC